jgi:hypothetical protein
MSVASVKGASYYVTFIDDFSRKTWIYFMKTKDEVFSHFREFKAQVENMTRRKIKVLRTNNRGEYTPNSSLISTRRQKSRGRRLWPTTRSKMGLQRGRTRSVEKYKARFVARGFSQKEGIDYEETFAPLAKNSSIRAVLSIASKMGGASIRWM